MEILHVYGGPFPSHQGTQVALRGLLAAQAQRGHRVVLRCAAHGAGDLPPGVEIRRLPPTFGGSLRSGPSWSRVRGIQALAACLADDARTADVIHAHHVDAPLVARHRGRPVVYHLHASLAQELPIYAPFPGVRHLGAAVDRACVRAADAVVVFSAAGSQIARSYGARLVVEAPPGLGETGPEPDREMARRRLGLGARAWVVYAGNLDRYQDLPDLVAALVRHRLPWLVVTGDDPAPLRRMFLRAGGAPGDLRTVQERSYPKVRRWCAAGDVAAVPRRTCAGFPMKILNLLEVGLPVVAPMGAADARPGLVRVDGPAFGPTLANLCADPARAAALGRLGRGGALACRWDAAASATESLYGEIISGRK